MARPPTQLASTHVHHILLLEEWLDLVEEERPYTISEHSCSSYTTIRGGVARPPTQLASTPVHHILLLEEEWLDLLHN